MVGRDSEGVNSVSISDVNLGTVSGRGERGGGPSQQTPTPAYEIMAFWVRLQIAAG